MSVSQTELRQDQMTLYPMQQELDSRTKLQVLGGLALWMMGMSVPILLLFELRYVMAGSYVDPAANPVLGGLGLLALLVTAGLLTVAERSVAAGNRKAIARQYAFGFWFQIVALVLIGWQVFDRSLSTLTHYGMTYMACAGTVDFYILCGAIAVLATRGRVKRISGIQNYWGTRSTMIFSWFLVIVWLVMFALLYFL